MRGDNVGEFEELTLLAVRALGPETYGVPVQQFVERMTGRNASIGAVYTALDRLEDKGLVKSVRGDATPVRGGKRKRLYDVTPAGRRTLERLRTMRDRIWQAIEATER
ncbi:MAG: helix-turn-helix transcriptional regulator [Vicinamibacterales bacterium]